MKYLFSEYGVPDDVMKEFEAKLSRGCVDVVGLRIVLMKVEEDEAEELVPVIAERVGRIRQAKIQSSWCEVDFPFGRSLFSNFRTRRCTTPRRERELLALLERWEKELLEEGRILEKWAYLTLILRVRKPSKRLKDETVRNEILLTRERPELNVSKEPVWVSVGDALSASPAEARKYTTEELLQRECEWACPASAEADGFET